MYSDLAQVGVGGDIRTLCQPPVPKLLVAVGTYSFEIDVLQTNGTADWSVTKYRALLIGLAKVIAQGLR